MTKFEPRISSARSESGGLSCVSCDYCRSISFGDGKESFLLPPTKESASTALEIQIWIWMRGYLWEPALLTGTGTFKYFQVLSSTFKYFQVFSNSSTFLSQRITHISTSLVVLVAHSSYARHTKIKKTIRYCLRNLVWLFDSRCFDSCRMTISKSRHLNYWRYQNLRNIGAVPSEYSQVGGRVIESC